MDFERIKDMISSEFREFEIYYSKLSILKFESREKSLSSFEKKEEEGLALRVKIEKRMAFSYTFLLDEAGIERLKRNVTEISPYVSEDDDYGFPEKPDDKDYPKIPKLAKTKDIPLDRKVDDLIRMEEEIRNDRRIVATRHCELLETHQEIRVFNSNGLSAHFSKDLYVLSALAVSRDGNEVSWYDYTWAKDYEDLDFLSFAKSVREKAISFLGAERLDTGIFSGILSPRASSEFLAILSHSFLSENLYKDKTKLKGKIDQKVFSQVLSIESNGTYGPSASPFDGEGSPCKAVRVVENGFFRSFLFDSFYSRKFKTKSTGNSVRENVNQAPRCGVIGMFVVPGDNSLELHEGEVMIEDLMGTHTANPVTGEFSLGAQGYVKKGGSLRPFLGVIVAGNVFELFQNVKLVGKDLRFYGNFGSPSLYVTDLKISGL